MIYKRCSRCGKRIIASSRCTCVSLRHKEDAKYREKKQTIFYSSYEWNLLRKQAIAKYEGIDIFSLYERNIIEPGFTVHHIIPLNKNWERRLDITNLIFLTESNHRLIHKQMETDEEGTETLLFDLIQRFLNDKGVVKKFKLKV